MRASFAETHKPYPQNPRDLVITCDVEYPAHSSGSISEPEEWAARFLHPIALYLRSL
jgi:hypothetical protein